MFSPTMEPMYRSLAPLAIFACLIAGGCDDNDTTAPSSQPIVFSASLSPANEVPPIAGTQSTGSGAVQIQFDMTRNAAGALTGGTATMYFQLFGFPEGTVVQGAHIHPGAAGVNGGVVLGTPLTATNTVTLASGSGEFTFSNLIADPTLVQNILNNPAGFYFNVHSPQNTGGFARGQLVRVQ